MLLLLLAPRCYRKQRHKKYQYLNSNQVLYKTEELLDAASNRYKITHIIKLTKPNRCRNISRSKIKTRIKENESRIQMFITKRIPRIPEIMKIFFAFFFELMASASVSIEKKR